MRLSAPKKVVWMISLTLAVISIVGMFVVIEFVTVYAFWIMAVAWLLLFLGAYLKNF